MSSPNPTTRNLWPAGIIVVCSLFVTGIAGLLVMACSQKSDLVSKDYYEQELRFQSQIDRVELTRREASKASVIYELAGKRITVRLPGGQGRSKVRGSIELYRPSAAGLDRAVALEPDANGVQHLDAAGLAEGLWRVRVSWTSGEQSYYLEEKVVVGAKAT